MSVDYAFKIAEEADDKTASVSVAYEHRTKPLWVLEADHKRVDSSIAADLLVGKLKVAGYGGVKVTLKSDNEASIIALEMAIAVRRKAEAALIESPVSHLVHQYLICIRYCLIFGKKRYHLIFVFKIRQKH